MEDLYEAFELLFRYAPPWLCIPISAGGFVGVCWWFKAYIPMLRELGYIFGGAFAAVILLAGFRGHMARKRREQLLKQNTDLASIKQLPWKEFERFIAALFQRRGYNVNETGNEGPDGGVDLRLNRDGEMTLVQCKRWNVFKVGVEPVRELLGVMAAEGAERGILVSTGTYTNAALRFAKGQPLELIDGTKLTEMICTLKHAKADPATMEATTVTASSAPFRPHCPKCNGIMDLKKARKGKNAGKNFWGCSRFPTCTGLRNAA